MEPISVSTMFAGRELTLETKKFARISDAAVVAKMGDAVLLVTVNISHKPMDVDFLPMMVDFREKFHSAGKIKGSRFIKREGRPSDSAVLICRVIDRSLRPLIPKGIRNDIEIVITPLSYDPTVGVTPLSIIGASAGLKMIGIPFEGPVAGIEMGLVNGELKINPAKEDLDNGDMKMVVAGIKDAVTMVEAGAKEVSKEIILEALELAHKEMQPVIQLQEELLSKLTVKEREFEIYKIPEELVVEVAGKIDDAVCERTLFYATKVEQHEARDVLEKDIIQQYEEKIENTDIKKADVLGAIDKRLAGFMRDFILKNEKRVDGRGLRDTRSLAAEVGLLPRTHGSGLFERGETQILTTATLGSLKDSLIIDTMEEDRKKRYIHYYSFPPFAVGEARAIRGTSRREIGHGDLAERALVPVIPSEEDFAYTMLLVSETLGCNGSSSMASICGSTLALMDAGVPIKRPVAGIAMGLVTDKEDESKYKILTDIQAIEDFCGDMDFKIGRTTEGITALQMDIKLSGLTTKLLSEVIDQSYEATDKILAVMHEVIAEPRKELSKYAPRIESFKIDKESIASVIGKQGKTIKEIIETTGAEINIDDTGMVSICSVDPDDIDKAMKMIKRIVYKPRTGEVYDGFVKRILDFGALVEFLPGKVGMVHISQLADKRVEKVTDECKEGDKMRVKLLAMEGEGRYSLSRKAVKPEDVPVF